MECSKPAVTRHAPAVPVPSAERGLLLAPALQVRTGCTQAEGMLVMEFKRTMLISKSGHAGNFLGAQSAGV